MASVADIPYCITNDGTIFDGYPDDPSPETNLRELPIFKEHPQERHFFKFPFSAFEEQLALHRGQRAAQRHAGRPNEETEEAQYDCFVCGKQHTVVVEKEPDY